MFNPVIILVVGVVVAIHLVTATGGKFNFRVYITPLVIGAVLFFIKDTMGMSTHQWGNIQVGIVAGYVFYPSAMAIILLINRPKF